MNKHECSECGTEYLLCANCERIRRFDGTAPYIPTQSAAARLDRVVERFERYAQQYVPVPFDDSRNGYYRHDHTPRTAGVMLGDVWEHAEAVEAFIEGKRRES